MARLLEAVPKAALSVAYGTGLRVSKVAIRGARFGCGASGDAPAGDVVDERSSAWGRIAATAMTNQARRRRP